MYFSIGNSLSLTALKVNDIKMHHKSGDMCKYQYISGRGREEVGGAVDTKKEIEKQRKGLTA